MRADHDAELAPAVRRARHRLLVAVVPAAGDVRGVDEGPDFVFAGRAFAHVGADVDHVSLLPSSRAQRAAHATRSLAFARDDVLTAPLLSSREEARPAPRPTRRTAPRRR